MEAKLQAGLILNPELRSRLADLYNQGMISSLEQHFAGLVSQNSQYESIKAVLACVLVRALSEGHVALSQAELVRYPLFSEISSVWELGQDETKVLAALEESWYGMAVYDKQRLYLKKNWHYESRFAQWCQQRLKIKPQRVEFKTPSGSSLDQTQCKAVSAALKFPFCVISGGPGTGKTTVISSIVNGLLDADSTKECIAVCAPTGKAVARLNHALQGVLGDSYCQTIHRLLGWQEHSGRFKFNSEQKLPYKNLIIDEASMIDLEMMFMLIQALPDECSLVLVGDHGQLASVLPGNVLTELYQAYATEDFFVELKRNYRFAADSALGQLAVAIRSGDENVVLELLSQTDAQIQWDQTDQTLDVGQWFKSIVPEGFLKLFSAASISAALEAAASFRILCTHRIGVSGAQWFNQAFMHWFRTQNNTPISQQLLIATQNNYRLSVFNGDTLIRQQARDQAVLWVEDIGTKPRRLSLTQVAGLESAVAITAHKSQGSEFDHVAVVLAPDNSPLLSRELFYTAVTRAKKKLSLLASEQAVRTALRQPTHRYSGLAQRLLDID